MTAQQNNAKLHITVYSICCAKIKNGSPPPSPPSGAKGVISASHGRRPGGAKDPSCGARVSRSSTDSETEAGTDESR